MSRGPRWTEIEHRRLIHLRNVERLPWCEISIPGRSSSACEMEYHKRRFADLLPPGTVLPRKPRKDRRGRPPMKPRPLSPQIERAIPAASRADLERLRQGAELQNRIAERGLTGGVFGDPPPGRSALDERRKSNGPAAT